MGAPGVRKKELVIFCIFRFMSNSVVCSRQTVAGFVVQLICLKHMNCTDTL